MKKLSILLLAVVFTAVTLEAGRRTKKTSTVSAGDRLAATAAEVGLATANSLAQTATNVATQMGVAAATAAINKDDNIDDAAKEELIDLVKHSGDHVNETVKVLGTHAENLGKLSIKNTITGELSDAEMQAEVEAAAGELATDLSVKGGDIANRLLTTSGNIANIYASKAAENTDNEYLKALATAGGEAAQTIGTQGGKLADAAVSVFGEEEGDRRLAESDRLFDIAEADDDFYEDADDDDDDDDMEGDA